MKRFLSCLLEGLLGAQALLPLGRPGASLQPRAPAAQTAASDPASLPAPVTAARFLHLSGPWQSSAHAGLAGSSSLPSGSRSDYSGPLSHCVQPFLISAAPVLEPCPASRWSCSLGCCQALLLPEPTVT